jgi:hypothetical protein
MEELLASILKWICEICTSHICGIFFTSSSKQHRSSPECGADTAEKGHHHNVSQHQHISPECVQLCLLWFIYSCIAGLVSVALYPNAVISIAALRVVNLILVPAVAYYMLSWPAFFLTVPFVLIRFAYVTPA